MDLEQLVPKIVIIVAAAVGFYAARLIQNHKKQGTKLVCPLDSNCEAVVHSKYSKFMGVPLETLGLSYYVIVIVGYAIELFIPSILPFIIVQLIVAISIAAFFFSLYLTGLQLFKIKEWCAWCLVSASMCLIIFISSLILYGGSIMSF